MADPLTIGIGSLAWGTGVCAVQGILGNRTDAAAVDSWRVIGERLRQGALPPNHDLFKASQDSLRQASLFLLGSLAAKAAPKRTLAEIVNKRWREGQLFDEPILEWFHEVQRAWVKEFERKIRRPDAFHDLQGDFPLDAPNLSALVEANPHHELAGQVHEAVLDWTERNVQPSARKKKPDFYDEWIRYGWSPDGQESGEKITFFQAYCLHFQDHLKRRPEVMTVFTAEMLQHIRHQLDQTQHEHVKRLQEHLDRIETQVSDLADEFVHLGLAAAVAEWEQHFANTWETLSVLTTQQGKTHELASVLLGLTAGMGADVEEVKTLVATLLPEIAADVREIDRRTHQTQKLVEAIHKGIAKGHTFLLHLPSDESLRFETSRIPLPTHRAEFVGRSQAIIDLDNAVQNAAPTISVVHGFGGVGKSTILWNWVQDLSKRKYDGMPQVFAWSFYEQGQRGESTSSGPFFVAAREHFMRFGCDFLKGMSADRLGEGIATALRAVGGLLILDGLEPLQYAPEIHGGIRDEEISDLIRTLAGTNPTADQPRWHVVVTTRWPFKLPKDKERLIEVENLGIQDAAKLLRSFRGGRDGRQRLHYKSASEIGEEARLEEEEIEFREAAGAFGGNPLALILLASNLLEFYGGALEFWRTVQQQGNLADDELGESEQPYRHARRVMSSYWNMLVSLSNEEGTRGEQASLAIKGLSMIALFDRPARPSIFKVVYQGEEIAGLTEAMTESKFASALKYLRRLQIVSPESPVGIDMHPLIRQKVAKLLLQHNPDAWKAGQSRLFEHYRSGPSYLRETDVERGERLAISIMFGCRAHRHPESCKLYMNELVTEQAGRDTWKSLSSKGDDLAVLSNFFERPWSEPATNLAREDAGELCNESGYDLFKLCRFREAERSFATAFDIWEALENKRKCSRDSVLLGKQFIAQGKLTEAREVAQRAISYTEQFTDDELKEPINRKECINALAFHGEACHHLGKWSEAAAAFEEADASIHGYVEQFEDEVIYATRVLQHANFLLDQGDWQACHKRVRRAMDVCRRNPGNDVDETFNELLIGNILIARFKADGNEYDMAEAFEHLNRAMNRSWDSAMIDCQFLTHLALAEWFAANGQLDSWNKQLDQAWEICEPGDAKRFQVEWRLSRIELDLQQNNTDLARENYDAVCEDILVMRYFRRLAAVRKLAEAGQWPLPAEYRQLPA